MAAMGNLLKDIRKGREDRSLYLRGILPYLFALGCARAWVTLAVAAPAPRTRSSRLRWWP